MSKQYDGPKSKHYNGKVFLNQFGVQVDKPLADLIRWQMEDKTPFPEYFETPYVKIKSERVDKGYAITFINHATVLIQTNNLNILTDPIWSKRASPIQWAGPQRVTNPAVKFEDLPPIDVVLISHNHFDHMDLETIDKLEKVHKPLFLMGLGNSYYLDQVAVERKRELDWWQLEPFKGVEFHFVPVQHWSKRGLFDTNKSLWGGFVIKSVSTNIYFSGDTGYADHFKQTKEKLGPFEVALLPIGAYEPRWFMKEQHMNPEEAVKAHIDLEVPLSIGIHYATFQLTNEGIDQPAKELVEALSKHNISSDAFIAPKFGQIFSSQSGI